MNNNCDNTNVVNELDIPILCMGLKNVIISASPDGILVSDKEQSSFIKPFVDSFDENIRYAEKSWGTYKVIDVGTHSMTIKIELMPNHKMNYHKHEFRDEVWIVIEGEGIVTIDYVSHNASEGYVFVIKAGSAHTVTAKTRLIIMESQIGKDISVNDKIIIADKS